MHYHFVSILIKLEEALFFVPSFCLTVTKCLYVYLPTHLKLLAKLFMWGLILRELKMQNIYLKLCKLVCI